MKKVLLTGVSRGIGKQILVELLERGCMIHALTSNKQHLNLPFTSNLKTDEINFLSSDLDQTLRKLEFLDYYDVVIHNAGKIKVKDYGDFSQSDLEEVYRVNVFGPFLLTQHILNKLKRGSHIIGISSVGGVTGTAKFPGLSAYSSSKGAMSIWLECLAEELKERGVFVNGLALGAVNTEMLATAFPSYEAEVSPKEMANYICDFALQENILINGKNLLISKSTP